MRIPKKFVVTLEIGGRIYTKKELLGLLKKWAFLEEEYNYKVRTKKIEEVPGAYILHPNNGLEEVK